MKSLAFFLSLVATCFSLSPGLDIDRSSGLLPFGTLGVKFVGIQTTYGMAVTNSIWISQRDRAHSAQLIIGGIHYPKPFVASAADQAKFFTLHGGKWTADGMTLPGTLYLEQVPGQNYCFGLTPEQWVTWIKKFIAAYSSLNGRPPMLMTSYNWWKSCARSSTVFGRHIPLWVIDLSGRGDPTAAGNVPIGWSSWKFWKEGVTPLYGKDEFNGAPADLVAFVS